MGILAVCKSLLFIHSLRTMKKTIIRMIQKLVPTNTNIHSSCQYMLETPNKKKKKVESVGTIE